MSTQRIDLDSKYLTMVLEVLKKHLPPKTKVYLFGSRTMGRAKPFSDIDLMIDMGKILTLEQRSLLEKDFEESLLPYKVDLVDAFSATAAFKAAIQQQLILIYP